ncbi:hypothetical protein CCH79_00013955 [Gambusia affinis]|uniref:Uncharacterized protein n=1 Tax=Gambusia affinis TaxID=33528 RepID=A0A315W2B6_GAMAF|nr:hypothetical protein CCH79_00013955 [Gambusia affinis]
MMTVSCRCNRGFAANTFYKELMVAAAVLQGQLQVICDSLWEFEMNFSNWEVEKKLTCDQNICGRKSGTSQVLVLVLLCIPRTRTKRGEAAFSIYAPKIWNKLPENCKTVVLGAAPPQAGRGTGFSKSESEPHHLKLLVGVRQHVLFMRPYRSERLKTQDHADKNYEGQWRKKKLQLWRLLSGLLLGFESILEGLFGPGLVKDVTFFQDCEPEEVSDWSFDENCLFCCLRREKNKEHIVENGGGGHVLSECEDLKQGQSRISRLERQARDFLNAVFHRKGETRCVSLPAAAPPFMEHDAVNTAGRFSSLPIIDADLETQTLIGLSFCSSSAGRPSAPRFNQHYSN